MVERTSATGWPALFWHAFEHSTNAMVLLDANRVIVEINLAYVNTFGYTRERAIGHYAESFVPPSMWTRLTADWVRLMRNGVATGKREIIRADGRAIWVQDAARHETVTGRNLILYVVLEALPGPSRNTGGATGRGALTQRELQVVSELAMGRRVREIADNLHMAPTTAQTHARHAMAKLGARSQAHLVAIAFSEGLLDGNMVHSHD